MKISFKYRQVTLVPNKENVSLIIYNITIDYYFRYIAKKFFIQKSKKKIHLMIPQKKTVNLVNSPVNCIIAVTGDCRTFAVRNS